MALIETKIPVPATERIQKNVQCDLCGAVALRDDYWPGEDPSWDDRKVTIAANETTSTPGGSWTHGETYDCCPSCFTAKVRPALIALGLAPRKTECSW